MLHQTTLRADDPVQSLCWSGDKFKFTENDRVSCHTSVDSGVRVDSMSSLASAAAPGMKKKITFNNICQA